MYKRQHIYISLQEIISREISATKPAVVTIGKFAGGDAPNTVSYTHLDVYKRQVHGHHGRCLAGG